MYLIFDYLILIKIYSSILRLICPFGPKISSPIISITFIILDYEGLIDR